MYLFTPAFIQVLIHSFWASTKGTVAHRPDQVQALVDLMGCLCLSLGRYMTVAHRADSVTVYLSLVWVWQDQLSFALSDFWVF